MTGERDDFLEGLEAVEADALAEVAARKAKETQWLADEPFRRARIDAIHDHEAQRKAAASERLETARADAQVTAAFLVSKGITPSHQTELEGVRDSVNLWHVSFRETGTPKDPPQESPSHPLKSESMIFEGTTVRVFGIGLDEAGNLYRLGGEYDIEGEYRGGFGVEQERHAKRKVVATKLDVHDDSVLLERMPPLPGGRKWPELEYDTGGKLLFYRVRREPRETEESYRQRLDGALEAWREQLIRLVQTELRRISGPD